MHVLLTRPEIDSAELKAELEARGHEVTVEPLLRIEPVPIEAHAFDGARAVIGTSRNGLRALAASDALSAALKLPIFAVGPATADLARELGFQRVISGAGTARDLVPLIADATGTYGPLVHIAAETLAFDLAMALAPKGIEVRTLTVYRAVAASSLSAPTTQGIARGAIDSVLLMSPRTASIFAQLADAAGLKESARRLTLFCLSQAVAAKLGNLAPACIVVAAEPNLPAMLAAIARVASQSTGV
jgi:uroporphyrinogen-III synthase